MKSSEGYLRVSNCKRRNKLASRLGPKQYALELKSETTGEISHVIKLRGVVMDSAASEKINFATFYDIVVGTTSEPIVTERMTLKRRITAIQTVPEKKKYAPVNEKGYRHTNNRIYPFGYEQPPDS